MDKTYHIFSPFGLWQVNDYQLSADSKSELGILHLSDQPPAPRNGERWSGVFLSDS